MQTVNFTIIISLTNYTGHDLNHSKLDVCSFMLDTLVSVIKLIPSKKQKSKAIASQIQTSSEILSVGLSTFTRMLLSGILLSESRKLCSMFS